MKKLIIINNPKVITLDDALNSGTRKLYAYESKGKSGWCFLTKITEQIHSKTRYGFVAMNYTDTHPRFVADTIRESITLASHGRDVYVFDDIIELARSISGI
jgi:hypothetical protein